MTRKKATNFDVRITKEEAEYLLKENFGYTIMCKEYGEDSKNWVGLLPDDLNEDGTLDDDYKTFEIFLSGNYGTGDKEKEKLIKSVDELQAELYIFNLMRLLILSKVQMEHTASFWTSCEKGIRSDSQLIADALNSAMPEELNDILTRVQKFLKQKK